MFKGAIILVVLLGLAIQYWNPTILTRHSSSPVVSIADGNIEGGIAYSRDGQQYFQYLSIPYAEPPVKNLRFEPPIPLRSKWSGVRQATSYPPMCLQLDFALRGTLLGMEDCLYLNVFTHSLKGKRPVMVWIHGGGYFSGGSRLYHPDFFMDQEGIVLVTINYRLGPLGFMNLEDGLIRGNMGLKDQTMALKWVQKNIGNFGGDPDKVTIFGESAGAGSVEYQMISPASKGLFHRAILESGAVTMPTALSSNPRQVALQYLKGTECPGDEKERTKLVECLKNMDIATLIKGQISLMDPSESRFVFLPSVETKPLTKDTFLSENPRNLLKSGKLSNNVPVMIGVTSGEGVICTASIVKYPELFPEIDRNWQNNVAKLLFYEESYITPEMAVKIREHYFQEKWSFTDNVHEFERNFSRLASDAIFFEPIERSALLHAKSGSPTYLFYYDYEATLLPSIYSLVRASRHDDWIMADLKMAFTSVVDMGRKWIGMEGAHEFGVPHSGGLLMQWNMEGWTGLLAGPDKEFSKSFLKALTDFAKNEKPLKFNGVPWTPINKVDTKSPSSWSYMLIGKEPKVIRSPIAEGAKFWNSLGISDE